MEIIIKLQEQRGENLIRSRIENVNLDFCPRIDELIVIGEIIYKVYKVIHSADSTELIVTTNEAIQNEVALD